ncbi:MULTISPECIES: exodeoxyribonuclease VII small subunit [Hymenobacter]|uniref:Exodeoxyribonuclease 7 small subunit n=1 Tax=Hymenobacter jejuensis TaxID=2502781 RepID=A0A5B7ZVG6_9BACT|nr:MULTISPECIES: exodeoxyribonuclease VII small subunit [Hymenobacter]MBC6988431.1 exodeoxyribonuclease VII small subunit [Hymenobacter sp. BT491]QDA59214.1 exodeoxyribonuclease VII small subunit [Hymenobacter jejuensis]
MTNDITYRQAIAELETILRSLETETVDVDDLTARVQRSAELIRLCKQKLRSAESAIDRVFENLDEEEENLEEEEEEFSDGEEEDEEEDEDDTDRGAPRGRLF